VHAIINLSGKSILVTWQFNWCQLSSLYLIAYPSATSIFYSWQWFEIPYI